MPCVSREHVSCSDLRSNQHCIRYFRWKWEMLRSALKAEVQLWIHILQRAILAFSAAGLSATQLPDTSLKRLINTCMLIHVSFQSYPQHCLNHAWRNFSCSGSAIPPRPSFRSVPKPSHPTAPPPSETARKHSDLSRSSQHNPKTAGEGNS